MKDELIDGNDLSKVPDELKRQEQWVLWREETKNERQKKVPYTTMGKRAAVDNPETWVDFEVAEERLALSESYDGLGFVFTDSDPFCGVDLDACRNPNSGKIEAWAHRWIEEFDSYTEISPSGTGVKIWIIGRNPRRRGGNIKVDGSPINGKTPGVEIYDQGRFFAVTGKLLEGGRGTIESRQVVLDEFVAEYWPALGERDAGTVSPAKHEGLERCWRYVQKMPDAISGQGGHNATFAAACECYRFGLTDSDAREVMRRFNEQKTGGEQWNSTELDHKLTDAKERVSTDQQLRVRTSADSTCQSGATFSSNADQRRGDAPTKILLGKDEGRVNDEAIRALAGDPGVFQRGGALVQVIKDGPLQKDGITRDESLPRIVNLAEITVRERLTRLAVFCEEQRKRDQTVEVEVHPPGWCYKAIHQRGTWENIPRLASVASNPFLRADGTVVDRSGFDWRSGVYCAFDESLGVPDVPSQHDAVKAASRLLDVVCDFPFATPEHQAAWVACLLTPLARFAFAGPAPLFLFDANVRGSGKSLLADLISLLVYGSDVARMTNPRNDEEARKRITALAITGDPIVLIDNIVGTLGCPALDAALTCTIWKDRVLGASSIVEVPLLVTWLATGNNVMLQADTSRRVLHIRLESEREQPEEREDFTHPDIKQYVRAHRVELLAAAVTVLSAYYRAKHPKQNVKPWGSFEGWSASVREAVVWAGLPDPGLTRQELLESSDREAGALRDLLDSWHQIDPDGLGITTAELLDKLQKWPDNFVEFRTALIDFCPPKRGDLPSTQQIGNQLAHVRRRVLGGKSLDYHEQRGRRRAWYVTEASSVNPRSGDTDDSGDTV